MAARDAAVKIGSVKIGVVVVSRNEGAELRRTLQSLRETLPPRSEIVIVDDHSTDGSTAGLRRVVKAPGIGVARARNLGASRLGVSGQGAPMLGLSAPGASRLGESGQGVSGQGVSGQGVSRQGAATLGTPKPGTTEPGTSELGPSKLGTTMPHTTRLGRPGLGTSGPCTTRLGTSKGTGDLLVFADAHIRLDPDWWRPMAEILEDPKVGAVAPAVTHLPATRGRGFGLTFTGPDLDARWLPRKGATPFAAPILPGCCLMMRRDTFDAVGGWDSGLLHRGGVDNEMSVRLWLLGYELLIAPQVVVRHLFRKTSPYPVGWPQYLHNRLRLAFAHLNPPRLGKVVKALHNEPAFGEAMAMLIEGDISARRRDLLARRARTDEWFFERFGMKW